MKPAQLTLLSDPRPWRLDEKTRRVGRAGVARAREALRREDKALRRERRDGRPGDHHDLAA